MGGTNAHRLLIPADPSWYYYRCQSHGTSCKGLNQHNLLRNMNAMNLPTSQKGHQGGAKDQFPRHGRGFEVEQAEDKGRTQKADRSTQVDSTRLTVEQRE